MKLFLKVILYVSILFKTVYSTSDFDIRLSGGDSIYKGRLEMYYKGEWGTVCNDEWSSSDAVVACRQLEFGPLISFKISGYEGDASQPIWLDDVRCGGYESGLSSCSHSKIGIHDCTHAEDVALECSIVKLLVRLADGSKFYNGRLEVYSEGKWGSVCKTNWNDNDTHVVCRQLGFFYPLQSEFSSEFYFSDRSVRSVIGDVQCSGSESHLLSCPHQIIGENGFSCSYYLQVGLECFTEEDFTVRLVDGIYANVGRLEVYTQGKWTNVCKTRWTEKNSQVVCQQLGYLRADNWVEGYEVSNTVDMYLFDFDCQGHEDSLKECRRSDDDGYHCEPVRLQCTNEPDYYSNGDARLVGREEGEGFVEVYLYGTWGRMCPTYWTYFDSEILCKQLGFGALTDITKLDEYYYKDITPVQHLPVHNVTFVCRGGEDRLSNCTNNDYNGYCTMTDEVVLTCETNKPLLGCAAIAGIIVGLLVMLFVLICISLLIYKKRKTSEEVRNTNTTETSIPLTSKHDLPHYTKDPEI